MNTNQMANEYKQLLRTLLEEYNGDTKEGLLAYIAHELQVIDKTEKTRMQLLSDIRYVKSKAEQEIAGIEIKINENQNNCRHRIKVFNTTESGDYNTFYTCAHCGKAGKEYKENEK